MKRLLLLSMLVLALALVVTGAYPRLATDGIDCQPWPACYGQDTTAQSVRSAPVARAMRSLHLACLAAYGLLALALPLVIRRAVALAPFLAFLLASSTVLGSTLPLATLGQTLGGLAMLATLLPLLVAPRHEPLALSRAGRRALIAFVVLFTLQVATGTLISVRSAGAACAVACDIVWLPGVSMLFDPLQTGTAIELLRNTAAGQPLQALHRLAGIALALAAMGGTMALVPAPHGRPLVLMLAATALLGMTVAANDGPVVAVIAHALAAAVAIGLLGVAVVHGRVVEGSG